MYLVVYGEVMYLVVYGEVMKIVFMIWLVLFSEGGGGGG